ncbi:Uncharacterised protein [Enterobacter kobei]|nr:Uncharacterised protein [Enterobacter kobei]
MILLRSAHHETLIRLVFHLNTKGVHQVQGDINVRLRNQVAFNVDDGVLWCQRCGHQQRGQELAGNATVNLNIAASESPAQTQGRVIFLLKIINLRAALTQGIHQMADRTLFHSRLTGQHNIVTPQTQRCGQRTHRGTGVTQEKLQRFSRM